MAELLTKFPRRRTVLLASLLAVGMTATACSAPGEDRSSTQKSDAAVKTELGADPITLEMYAETGFPLAKALADEFSKQHPNVKFNIREDQFTVIVENAPRVMAVGQLARHHPAARRWSTWSRTTCSRTSTRTSPRTAGTSSRLAAHAVRASATDTRGTGSLYAMGLDYSVTGVFYNKKLAAQIGMTQPPATVAEFEELLAKAKAGGVQPIMQFEQDHRGLNFPHQALHGRLRRPDPVNDWIFQKPGATIDTPAEPEGHPDLQKWIQAGYFPKDINALDYAEQMGAFQQGQRPVHVQRRLGVGQPRQAMAGNVGLLPVAPRAPAASTRRCPRR